VVVAPLGLGEEFFSLGFAPEIAIVGTSLFLSVWRTIYSVFLSGGAASQRVLIFGAGVYPPALLCCPLGTPPRRGFL
jgi:hypothetical protein